MPKERINRKLKTISCLVKEEFNDSELVKSNPDITTVRGFVLGYINRHNQEQVNVYQKDIERDFRISKATASELLDSLEEQQLIKRVVDEQDKRKKRLELTEPSISLTNRINNLIDEINEKMIQGFSKEEVLEFNQYLDRIIKNLEKEDDSHD